MNRSNIPNICCHFQIVAKSQIRPFFVGWHVKWLHFRRQLSRWTQWITIFHFTLHPNTHTQTQAHLTHCLCQMGPHPRGAHWCVFSSLVHVPPSTACPFLRHDIVPSGYSLAIRLDICVSNRTEPSVYGNIFRVIIINVHQSDGSRDKFAYSVYFHTVSVTVRRAHGYAHIQHNAQNNNNIHFVCVSKVKWEH